VCGPARRVAARRCGHVVARTGQGPRRQERKYRLRPESAEVDAKVLEYPGATVAAFNAFYDYIIAYVATLCAGLPTETGAKCLAAKRVSSL